MKFLNLIIEWVVVLALGLLGPFDIFQNMVQILWSNVNLLFNLVRFVLVFIILLYQKQHYGFKSINVSFILFFLLYTLYIYFYLTFFRDRCIDPYSEEYPITTFIFKSFFIVVLFLCADTIILKFNCIKFLFLSVFLIILPAMAYIQIFGTEVLQLARLEVGDSDRVSLLGFGYSGATIFVMASYLSTKYFKVSFSSFIFVVFVAAFAGYITIISGERGPILWGGISLWLCFLVSSKKLFLNIIVLLALSIIVYLSIDLIIEFLFDFAPKTAEKIYLSVYEGNSSGRLDLDNPGGTTYGDAVKQIASSPVIGSYFRLMKDYSSAYCGGYPHNIFLEFLMTMGLLGFIPLCAFIFKVYFSFRKIILNNYTSSIMCIFIMFVFIFLRLQTSGTIYLNIEFWVYFYLMSVMPKVTKIVVFSKK